MTEYQRMEERDRKFWRRVRIVWWLTVVVLLACIAVVYFWR